MSKLGSSGKEKGCLVAAVLLGALGAVAPNLFGKHLLGNDFEAEPLEKTGLTGEGEEKPFVGRTGLAKVVYDEFDEQPANALPVEGTVDDKRTDFKETAAEVADGDTAAETAAAKGDAEIADVRQDIRLGAAKDDAGVGIGFEQFENAADIRLQRPADEKTFAHFSARAPVEPSLSDPAVRNCPMARNFA